MEHIFDDQELIFILDKLSVKINSIEDGAELLSAGIMLTTMAGQIFGSLNIDKTDSRNANIIKGD